MNDDRHLVDEFFGDEIINKYGCQYRYLPNYLDVALCRLRNPLGLCTGWSREDGCPESTGAQVGEEGGGEIRNTVGLCLF